MLWTPWGYDIDDDTLTALPDIITPGDISIASGGRIADTDPRLPSVCSAVSAAIRDFCGWHVGPALPCVASTSVDDRIIYLPAKHVRAVSSVSVGDDELPASSYEWKRDGMVRLSHRPARRGAWGAYRIAYDAGVELASSTLVGVAAQIALNNLTASPGVRSESVGQVSLSYNQGVDGVAGGITLLQRDRELLAGYRLPTRPR